MIWFWDPACNALVYRDPSTRTNTVLHVEAMLATGWRLDPISLARLPRAR